MLSHLNMDEQVEQQAATQICDKKWLHKQALWCFKAEEIFWEDQEILTLIAE